MEQQAQLRDGTCASCSYSSCHHLKIYCILEDCILFSLYLCLCSSTMFPHEFDLILKIELLILSSVLRINILLYSSSYPHIFSFLRLHYELVSGAGYCSLWQWFSSSLGSNWIIHNGVTALHEALREEVQRLKIATGEISNGSGQSSSVGGQRVFQMQSQSLNAQQIQQLQQAQSALNNQQQSSQQQMHSEYLQRSGYGLSTGFMKAEGSSIAINHGSSASFGWFKCRGYKPTLEDHWTPCLNSLPRIDSIWLPLWSVVWIRPWEDLEIMPFACLQSGIVEDTSYDLAQPARPRLLALGLLLDISFIWIWIRI